MKYLVTGGAGFVGSNLAEALLKKGGEVVVFDDFSLGAEENLKNVIDKITVIRGDVKDIGVVRQAMEGVDYVFHQAAVSSSLIFKQKLQDSIHTNFSGLLNVLIAARENKVKRVIFASSSTVYGTQPIPFSEATTKPVPGNFYAASKLSTEHLAYAFSNEYGLETLGFRYMSIFGPHEGPKGPYANVLTQFLVGMLKGERPVIYGDGEQARDFTFVQDVVQANILASEAPGPFKGDVFNVGTGTMTTFNDVVAILNKVLGTNIEAEYAPLPIVGYQRHQLADISRISAALGYESRYPLEEGIRRLNQFLTE